jgi:hypothetical protein
MLTDMNNGGLGLIDHMDIVKAINAKQILAMENPSYTHPIKNLLGSSTSYFNRTRYSFLDDIARLGCDKINEVIDITLNKSPNELLTSDRLLMAQLKNERIKDLVTKDNSAIVAILNQQGICYGSQITNQELMNLRNILPNGTKKLLTLKIEGENAGHQYQGNINELRAHFKKLPNKNLRYYDVWKITSKTLRTMSSTNSQLLTPKLYRDVDNTELQSFYSNVKRLKNIRQKCIALRVIHGDIFSKSKLHKIGLIDSPNCPKCNQVETKEHLLYHCPSTKSLWDYLTNLTNGRPHSSFKDTLFNTPKLIVLKIKLELIGILYQINRPALDPRTAIRTVLNKLIICESKNKKDLNALLELRQRLETPV